MTYEGALTALADGEHPAGKEAMEMQPEAAPAQPVASGVPVQPEDSAVLAVPEDWVEGDCNDEADAVDRLSEDVSLVTRLALSWFSGPDYEYFRTVLATYGVAVISGWIRRDVIWAKCRQRGYGGLPEMPAGAKYDPDVADELAYETVALALVRFRDNVLVKRKWDAGRGASLRTYFVGQCLMQFANVYRTWWRHEARRGIPVDGGTLTFALDERPRDDVEDLAVSQVQVDATLRHVKDERLRLVLVYVSHGYTQSEIAEKLGVTTKTVERMIANERVRMRKRGIA